MGADTARQLVRAFATLPRELSSEMDAAGITLATRLEILRLDRGCREAARELWEAVKAKGRPELLPGAARRRAEQPGLDVAAAVEAAAVGQEEANQARAVANRREQAPEEAAVDPATVAAGLEVMRRLVAQIRRGMCLSPYDAGTLRLCAEEILAQLPATGVDDDQAVA